MKGRLNASLGITCGQREAESHPPKNKRVEGNVMTKHLAIFKSLAAPSLGHLGSLVHDFDDVLCVSFRAIILLASTLDVTSV